MANLGVLLLIDALEEDEIRNQANLRRRQLRDQSDPFSLPEFHFKNNFRLSKHLVMELVNILGPHLKDDPHTGCFIPKHLRILAALQFFGHGSNQKIVGQDFVFPMSQASVSRAIAKVSDSLEIALGHLIHFPANEEERNLEKQNFLRAPNGFPGIIGAIDCTHVCIVAPPSNHPEFPGHLFLDRNGKHSLNVQIVCSLIRLGYYSIHHNTVQITEENMHIAQQWFLLKGKNPR